MNGRIPLIDAQRQTLEVPLPPDVDERNQQLRSDAPAAAARSDGHGHLGDELI